MTAGPSLRIVHVLTRLLKAGSEENTLGLCRQQIADGHEVYIIHGCEYDLQVLEGHDARLQRIEVASLVHPISPLQDGRAFRQLRRLFREIAPDIIHTHQSKAGILARLAAWRCGAGAVVHTVHIVSFEHVGPLKKALYVAFEKLAARLTDRMISVSAGVRSSYIRHGIGDPARHAVIHSGMDIARFQMAVAPQDWHARIGGGHWQSKPNLVLMLAAFEERKRQGPFLRAMAPILAERPDLCLLFAGQGSTLEACRALASELGVDRQVRFLGFDPCPQELIAMADVCVLTSEREGLPRVVVQAIAGGKPVVVTDLDGIEEIVRHGENALVLGRDDLDGVARAIADLVDDETLRHRLTEGARRTDVAPWALEHMVVETFATYEQALAEARS